MDEEPAMSFYGVYDGHAGKDAAAFAASILSVAELAMRTLGPGKMEVALSTVARF